MSLIFSKKNEKIFWTKHSQRKMCFYRLSEQRVRRVLNWHQRIERGIAPETLALMQTAGTKKHPYEIWVMIQKKDLNSRIKIISAWKYPGRTKPDEALPKEILFEISQALSFF